MRVLRLLATLALFAFASQGNARDLLTNESLIRLARAEAGEALLLAVVQSAEVIACDTTPLGLLELKQAGVPESVLLALLERASATPRAPESGGVVEPPAEKDTSERFRYVSYTGVVEVSTKGVTLRNTLSKNPSSKTLRWEEIEWLCFEFGTAIDIYIRSKSGPIDEASGRVSFGGLERKVLELAPKTVRVYRRECPEGTP